MRDDQQPTVQSELEALKRSAELIAEVEQINRRINELSPAAGATNPAITDTWVDARSVDARLPDERS